MYHSKPRSPMHSSNDEFVENVWRIFTFGLSVAREIITGIFEFGLPALITAVLTLVTCLAVLNGWDATIANKIELLQWAYSKPALKHLLQCLLPFLPAFSWGAFRVVTKRNYRNEMDTLFQASGVTNRIGQTPKPVQNFTRGDGTKVLRVSAKGISVEDFKKSKPALEQSLRAHVDGFEANLAKGTIDIKYSKEPMPEDFAIDGQELNILRPFEFIIGKTKSNLIRADLDQVSHLLIAGETGGGKSTYLRQLITGLYLGVPSHGLDDSFRGVIPTQMTTLFKG